MTSEADQQFMDRVDLDLDLNNTADIQRLFDLARRGAAVQWREPTDAECANAAMSYRHDYGLLSDDMRKAMRHEARHWLYAWWKNIEMPLPPPPAGETNEL